MGHVALLSEDLINKIAAGEVVERPASVVKELVENALDAGATNVRVVARGGGLELLSVADDAAGMSREDAVLALKRHATSKLRTLDDLFQIRTMGFRGEALPAIAAVSRFVLTTSERGAASGTRLKVEGGEEPLIEEAPASGGTLVEVADLFFNTPARRKFMRRAQTELQHLEEAVLRVALARPDVGFFLEHEGRALLSSPPCGDDPRERIAAALGADVHKHLQPVDEQRLGIRVTGFVASPEFTLPTARGIYALVNRRYVRDRGLIHAIQRGFGDALPPGRQPIAVLFIELDPRAVDVNVHPQKLEVRFADGRGLYDVIVAGVSRALKAAPWMTPAERPEQPLAQAHYADAVARYLERAQPMLFAEPTPALPDAPKLGFGTARPGLNESPPPGYFRALRFLGALGRRLLVCEGAGGTLVVLDPHAAWERVRLTELHRALRDGARQASQGFLFSASVELSDPVRGALAEQQPALARLGIALSPFGGDALSIEAFPSMLAGADYRQVLIELSALLPKGDGALPAETLASALAVLACHAAEVEPVASSHEETRRLFDALEAADFALAASHARVVVRELPLLELLGR